MVGSYVFCLFLLWVIIHHIYSYIMIPTKPACTAPDNLINQQGSTRYIPTAHGSKPWCPRCCPQQLVRAAVLSSLAMKSSAQSAAVRPRAQDFRPQSGVPKKLPDTLFGGDASKGIDLQIFGPTLRKEQKNKLPWYPQQTAATFIFTNLSEAC